MRTLFLMSLLALIPISSAHCGGDSQDEKPDTAAVDVQAGDAPIAADAVADAIAPDTVAPSPTGNCAVRSAVVPKEQFFTDISEISGIRLNNHYPGQTQPINDHSRLGFSDLNGDGIDDIVMHSLFPNPADGIPFEHLVFLGNGDGTFTDFAQDSGLRDVQAGFFAFGDLDNDGDQDCFAGMDIDASQFGPGAAVLGNSTHQVLLNDGQGHFTALPQSGLEAVPKWVANAVLADFNGDAILDIFMGLGQTSAPVIDYLYFGKGDGTFQPATAAQFTDPNQRPSNGAVACDFDNDGDMDIFVATYSVSTNFGHNHLWQNNGGTFANVAVEKGVAFQTGGNTWLNLLNTPEPGKTEANYVGSNGFGPACADFTGDGLLDILLPTISHPVVQDYNRKWSDPTQLLVNQGPDAGYAFINEAELRLLPFNEGEIDGAIVDFDNDGRMDLSISREKKYEANYTTEAQKGWFGLMRQTPNGTFDDIGRLSGINQMDAANSASLAACSLDDDCTNGEICFNEKCRTPCTKNADCVIEEVCHTKGFCRLILPSKRAQNHAWADVDRDGDLDLLIGGRDLGGGRPNFLFRNDIGQDNRWTAFRVEGDGQNITRDAVGTRVTFDFGSHKVAREVNLSRGTYDSMDTKTLHFGLGEFGCDYTGSVKWPDGKTWTFTSADVSEGAVMRLIYPGSLTF